MTMPPGGAGPFSYEGDTVAAKLSVDVPADALTNLKQVTQGAHDLRVNMEAAARAQSDFVEYLRDLPALMAQVSEANIRLTESMERTTGGITSGRNDATQTNWGQPEVRLTHEGALQDLAERNPRQFANLMAQEVIDRAGRRGGGGERTVWQGDEEERTPLPQPRRPRRPQQPSRPADTRPRNPSNRGPGRDEEEPEWVDRFKQYQDRSNSFLQTIMNQTRAGGTTEVGGILGAGVQGVQGIAGRVQGHLTQRAATLEEQASQLEAAGDVAGAAETAGRAARLTSMGGMAGMALKGAGAAGLVVGGLAATQNVGQWYQGLAAQGMQRGGGFEEGAAFEMQTRTMAMNPFISLEQSRKIMQSALNQGYTGKEFDTVTEFMTENLTKMNIDVAQSVKVLQNQVQQGGQSLEAAQAGLRTAQQLGANPESMLTSGQSVEAFTQISGRATEAGVSGAGATELGLIGAAYGGENAILKSMGPNMAEAMMTNTSLQTAVARESGYSGPLGGAVPYMIETQGAQATFAVGPKQLDAVVAGYMPSWKSTNPGEKFRAQQMLIQKASFYGITLTPNQAAEMFKQADAGQKPSDFLADAQKNVREASTGGDVRQLSQGGEISALGGGVAEAGKTVGSLATGAWNKLLGNDERASESFAAAGRSNARSMGLTAEAGGIGQKSWTNPVIEELIGKYGTDIKLKDEQGKEVDFDVHNKGLMQSLVEGKSQLQVPGGDWTTLENFRSSMAGNDLGGDTIGGGTFGLTPDAARLLKLIPDDHRSQNDVDADYGSGNASRNNPPAGQAYGN